MKKIIRIIGALLTIVKFTFASEIVLNDPYLSNNIIASIQKISINKDLFK